MKAQMACPLNDKKDHTNFFFFFFFGLSFKEIYKQNVKPLMSGEKVELMQRYHIIMCLFS